MYDIAQQTIHKPLQSLAELFPDINTKLTLFTDLSTALGLL